MEKGAVPNLKNYLLTLLIRRGFPVSSCTTVTILDKPTKYYHRKHMHQNRKLWCLCIKSKERVTVLVCSNATGNRKLRLSLIVKQNKKQEQLRM